MTSIELETTTEQWQYFRPRYEHRNVVPYHPTMLLLWQAHMNLQRITNTGWSYYVLKYAMKSEPTGPLNLNSDDAKRIGVSHADESILKLISSYILTKPISLPEISFTCLQIPIIKRNETVQYVDSSPPYLR